MVIKPGQNGSRCIIPRELEKMIDRNLKEGYMTFDVSDIKDKQIDKIIELYSQAGWKVELIFDQRDGNYLEFKE